MLRTPTTEGGLEMKEGDKVTISRDAGYHIAGWVWNEVNGKTGTIVAPDEVFDWVVRIEGTPRQGGLFAFYEENLEVAE
jgi:hypothetical protein